MTTPAPSPASAPGARGGPVLSIRWIVTGAAVVLTAAAVLSVGFVAERNARAALTAEIETRLVLQARSLAAGSGDALLGDFPELALHPLARKLLADQPELALASVVDHRGLIQGHPDARRLGTPFAEPPGLAPLPGRRGLEPGESLRASADIVVAASPVRQADGRVIGTAFVGLRRGYLTQALSASRRQQALVLAVLVALGVVLAFLLMSQLLRPVGALRAGLLRISRGDLDSPIRLRDRTELGLLAETVNDMAATLKRAQAEMVERERLAHELELARKIQRSLLPAGAFAAGGFTVRGSQRPATEVGGDYYDILPLADGRVGIAIADVAGKGLSGCLVMTMLSALLRALRNSHDSPSAMLATLDERLAESLQPGVFVTMFYAVLDPAAERLTWASAGHNPTLVYRHASGRVERPASRGIPLGAVRGGAIARTLGDQLLTLGPGDMLVQYTDGYTEAFGPGGEAFGFERLLDLVARHGGGGGEAVLDGLSRGLEAWTGDRPPDDDETVLVVCRSLAPAPAGGAAPGDPAPGAVSARSLELLAEAERRGHELRLVARLETLAEIPAWIQRVPVLRDLRGADAELLASALYEVCANIAEHGCGLDGRRGFELWWLPPDERAAAAAPTEALPPDEASRRVREGCFLIRDDGAPFRLQDWKGADFSDAQVRKRGRGLGLDIIHRVMRRVDYQPTTTRGNVTLLVFGPHLPAPTTEGVTP